MAIIRLPGPEEGVFRGNPFAESFSQFLLEQGVSGVDPTNLGAQSQAFKQSLAAPPQEGLAGAPFNVNVQRGGRGAGGGLSSSGPPVSERELELLRAAAGRAGEDFDRLLNQRTSTGGIRRDRSPRGFERREQQRKEFDRLFELGIGQFSARLQGTRGTGARFQVKGGRRTGREEFV